MRIIVASLGMLAVAGGAYFVLRSAENRINDRGRISSRFKRAYDSASGYVNNLFHTEQPAS